MYEFRNIVHVRSGLKIVLVSRFSIAFFRLGDFGEVKLLFSTPLSQHIVSDSILKTFNRFPSLKDNIFCMCTSRSSQGAGSLLFMSILNKRVKYVRVVMSACVKIGKEWTVRCGANYLLGRHSSLTSSLTNQRFKKIFKKKKIYCENWSHHLSLVTRGEISRKTTKTHHFFFLPTLSLAVITWLSS